MTISTGLRELRQLASLYGVQSAYYGSDHRRHSAPTESLIAALQGLGANIRLPGDAPKALRERQQSLCQRILEPVSVAWDGILAHVTLRLTKSESMSTVECSLKTEDGQELIWSVSADDLATSGTTEVAGVSYLDKKLPLKNPLPLGYHHLKVNVPGLDTTQAMLVSAPTRAYGGIDEGQSPTWGIFIPLYALRAGRKAIPWPRFSDLSGLLDWISDLEGGIVGTLPLLPAFLDSPYDPSPYAPVSRLLWNEFYVDPAQAREVDDCREAREILQSPSFRGELEKLDRSPLQDYRKGMALKRGVLEKLAGHWSNSDSAEVQSFLKRYPVVEDYSRFRAVMEKRGEVWRQWPQRLQDGALNSSDYDEDVEQYHIYVQWLAHQQIQELSSRAHADHISLYLDLPLGVHPDGFDVWRWQDLFVQNFSVGAPPDLLATHGQNWGFPPMHPGSLRDSGYEYYIALLRHHFETCGLLRIDHVMGLHRQFWIPQGMDGTSGVYVRYPEEETYAILTLESQRNKVAVVGEDLGTVPPNVRPTMKRHGLYGMHVAYFQMRANREQPLRTPPSNGLYSINTHDLPPFAAFWRGIDVESRQKLGRQDSDGARQELDFRSKLKESLISFLQANGCLALGEEEELSVLKAILAWLGRSNAPMVLVNLEDLWLEVESQNVPGTSEEHPNWRHKAQFEFEEFSQMPRVLGVLQELNAQRKLANPRR